MRTVLGQLCLLLVLGLARPATAEPLPTDKLAAYLDQRLGAELQKQHVAGATVAVVQGGRIVALRGYGLAGVAPDRPVDPERTLFGLASTSKVFTWLTLLRAVEAGRVDLQRPVNDYLPPELRIPDQGQTEPIRGVDLLRHTTGFEDRDVLLLSTQAFGGHQPSVPEYLAAGRPDRVRPAGRDPSYSNYAPNLAAYMALQGSGAPDFPTLVERDLLAPLGMGSTTFREPAMPGSHLGAPMRDDLQERRTQNLQWDGTGFRAHAYEHMMDGPASGASATAADMARLMLALLHGGELDGQRIYGPKTAQALRTPLLDGAQSNRWAHGLMMYALPGGHTGYGHDGGITTAASTMVVVPDLDLGVFAAVNGREGGPLVWTLTTDLVREFYAPDAPGPTQPRPGNKALLDVADRYTGTYLTVRRPHHGLGELVMSTPMTVSVDPAGYLLVRSGGRDRRWVPAGPPGAFVDAEGEEVLAFRLGPDGRAVSFRDPLATRTLERVSPLYAMPVLIGLAAASVLCALGVLGAGAVRWWRRSRAAVSASSPVAGFDRLQGLAAVLLLAALASAVASDATADQASGAPFPPLPLRLFALLNCGVVLALLLGAGQLPRMWPAAGRWSRMLRLLAWVPPALLMLRFAVMGGLSFWHW
ncbi:MAG: class A beta-lactamase-related serine hydrolase [Burkholderiales bacterium]|nr:MAG: class A beta-lactamase-related serine hydrolase [Burkholderiales bacterium]